MAELKAKEVVNELWCNYMQTMSTLIHDKSNDDNEQQVIANFQQWYSTRPEILLKEFQSLADTLRLLLLIDEENKFVTKSECENECEPVTTASVDSDDEKSYITDTASHVEETISETSDSESESESESIDEELEDQYYIPLQSILHKILPMTNMLSYNDCESFRTILDTYFRECLEKEWI
jgi:hypothetical protein